MSGSLVALSIGSFVQPLIVSAVWIALASLMRDPDKRVAQAIIVAVAAGAYMDGGFGQWELLFTVAVGFCAYRGLRSYRWIAAGWAAHTVWDVLHHLNNHPMIAWLPASSFNCAVTDAVLAVWLFAHAPDPWTALGLRKRLFVKRVDQGALHDARFIPVASSVNFSYSWTCEPRSRKEPFPCSAATRSRSRCPGRGGQGAGPGTRPLRPLGGCGRRASWCQQGCILPPFRNPAGHDRGAARQPGRAVRSGPSGVSASRNAVRGGACRGDVCGNRA